MRDNAYQAVPVRQLAQHLQRLVQNIRAEGSEALIDKQRLQRLSSGPVLYRIR